MARTSTASVLATLAFISAVAALADERATVTGKVLDSAGKPLASATVMVYSAGVKKGYSRFCPTCYRDCGKRTITDTAGNYSIGGLDPELVFTLVAAKQGYLAAFIAKVDPAEGPSPSANLKPLPAVGDPLQIVRGKVVNTKGNSMGNAVIQPEIAEYKTANGQIMFATPFDWINEVTVTNEQGEFEVDSDKPAIDLTLRISAPGMAPKHFTSPTGSERQTMVVTEGAVIRGRLMYNGKGVADAEVGLVPSDWTIGRSYPEVRIGTAKDGSFAIANVPPGRVWLLRPMIDSLAARGIGAGAHFCETRRDGEEVNLGDIQLARAYTLRGQVLLDDGKPIPEGMRIGLTPDRATDAQIANLGPDGKFRFDGLPDGVYSIAPQVKGYRLPDRCASAVCSSTEVLIQRDVTDFVIRMVPAS